MREDGTKQEYFSLTRSNEEIQRLWDWARRSSPGRREGERPYEEGVLAACEYLMGEGDFLPQEYCGVFSPRNLLRQHVEQGINVGQVGDVGIHKPVHEGFHSLRLGNPKCLLYGSTPISGNATGGEGCINDGDKVFRGDADGGCGQS